MPIKKRTVSKTENKQNGEKTKTVSRGTTTRGKFTSKTDGVKAKKTTKSGTTTRSKVKIDGKTTEKYRSNKSGTRAKGVSKQSSGIKLVEKTRRGTTTTKTRGLKKK
jgi:hypothetical protein